MDRTIGGTRGGHGGAKIGFVGHIRLQILGGAARCDRRLHRVRGWRTADQGDPTTGLGGNAAREQARLLSQAVEQSPESIMVTGLDFRIEYVNESCVRISGYARDEMIGQTPQMLRSGLTPPDHYQDLAASLTAGTVWRGRFHNRRKSGELFIEAAIVSPIRNEAGEVTKYLAIKEDITEQLKVADQLEALAERMALATKAAGIGIWDWDIATNRLTWNDEMFQIYGVARERFGGTIEDWDALVDPDDLVPLRLKRLHWTNEGPDGSEEYRIVRPDGERRVIKATILAHCDGQGQPVRFLGTNWDVTDYRRAVDAAIAAQEHAEAANLAKSRFLANMSHELRTPLNAIIGFSDLLLAGEEHQDRRDQIEVIHQTGKTLLQLIQDILDYSTIEAGRVRLDEAEFSLLHELHAVAMLFRPEAQRQGLIFRLDVDPAQVPPRVRGGVRLLRQISAEFSSFASAPTVHLEEVTLAPPKPVELLVRIAGAGLCHSDLSVINGDRPRPVPIALGHEGSGEVVEVGSAISDVRVGDHVVFQFSASCGRCRCRHRCCCRCRPRRPRRPRRTPGDRITHGDFACG